MTETQPDGWPQVTYCVREGCGHLSTSHVGENLPCDACPCRVMERSPENLQALVEAAE